MLVVLLPLIEEAGGGFARRSVHIVAMMDTPNRSFETPEQAPDDQSQLLLGEDDSNFMEQILEEAEAVTGEFTNTFELEEPGERIDGNWWPSSDQIRSLEIPDGASFAIPKPSDWVEDTGKVYVAVDRARREYWSQLKAEVTHWFDG